MFKTVYPVENPRYRQLHPGELLRSLLEEHRIAESVAARRAGIPLSRFRKILDGRARITPPVANCIGRVFRDGPRLWINLQRGYDSRVGLRPLHFPRLPFWVRAELNA